MASAFTRSRIGYMVTLAQALYLEELTGQPVNTALVLAFKAAATGDRARFDRVVESLVPEPLQGEIRGLAEQTVWAELAYREELAADPPPKKSKMPPGMNGWHVEIRVVLELLLGTRDDPTPRVALHPVPREVALGD